MCHRPVFSRAVLLALTLALAACGGGGAGFSHSGDIVPDAPDTVTPTSGPDSFLLFPNPLKQADGTLQTDSLAYASAYYEAIDPLNERDTLAKFKQRNRFGVLGAGDSEETVIVGDQRDLGYGRKVTARRNADGSIAFVVENYLVGAYGAYSPLNLEAAIQGEARWHLGTNGVEFSPSPGGSVNFVKFYTYDPRSGARLLRVNLDGRGDKAMPGVCLGCHGGRADPLTPPDLTGKPRFARLMNSVSQMRGDVGAQLHPFEPAAFDFSASPPFTRALQESRIKTLNQMVLCAMPLPAPSAQPEDACRRTASINEYQGSAATQIKALYGGDGLPWPSTPTSDTEVPPDWLAAGQSTLYLSMQAQSCRVCHRLRGTGSQSDIDFETFSKFDSYSERIKTHVLERGNMPLAKLIYDKFWSTPSIYNALATYLAGLGYSDTTRAPGRPLADAGPDRVVKQLSSPLSAAQSLSASSYQWTIVSGPPGATLDNADTAQPTFHAPGNGSYGVQLVASRGALQSHPVTLKIVVDSALGYDPLDLRFADIKALLQAGGAGQCTSCHQPGGNGAVIPPIWYSDEDRDGNGVLDATDAHWFYTELRGRINFTDVGASALLRKPAGQHHNGLQRSGFDSSLEPGQPARQDYDKLLGWILNGAPE